MNKVKLICCAFAAIVFASCGNAPVENKKVETEAHDHAGHEGHYTCPMHPEVMEHAAGKCPKCGMDLVIVDDAANAKQYLMTVKAEPSQLTSQQNAVLFFTPHVKGNENEKVPLDIVHDKKIHLIVVSNDLSFFDHVHPIYEASGDYKIDVSNTAGVMSAGLGNATTQFPNGGDFTLYADYMPTGATHQLEKIPVHVDGKTIAQKTWTKESLVSKDKDFTMTLKSGSGKFYTKQTMHMDAPLMLNNKPVKTSELDDFLGAKAHMVVIGVNDMSYLHVHPEEHDGVLDLHADFDKAGFYRGWIQFKYKGELHTMSFALEVLEGTGNETTTHADGHEHGEEHKH